MTKVAKIELRVSEEEKQQIAQKARDNNSTMTGYILAAVNSHQTEDKKLRQGVASTLCQMTSDIENSSQECLRKDVKKWMQKMWRLLK